MRQLSKILFEKANNAIKTDEDLIVLTLVASVLASFGIVLDNEYILIGSMLIAPFFHPILSLATFIAGDRPTRIIASIKTLLLITFMSFTVSLMTYAFLSIFREISPVYLILGTQFEYLVVAIILGGIGALLWMWPKIPNLSAGISIGISLVPPLSNSAKSLFLSNGEVLQSSVLSFSMNLFGILLGAVLIIYFRNRVFEKKVKKI